MASTVVVSGNPRPASRTLALATAIGDLLARRHGTDDTGVVDVATLGAGLLSSGDPATATALDLVRGADLLVVATPTYKGTFTGVLKVLLDHLPARALDGTTAVPVVIAGVAQQASAAASHLAELLRELGADVVPGLAVVEAELADVPAVAATFAATLTLREPSPR
ncbi:NADPH-dependent FMN reductase [Micromonospora krabiensis]|uniref:FMN reductase n=1 Tax=Micromonospora krabiensis TaxID=307121 RepID=A0A1C3MX44_9ACTN|nr:NAD(P)H-dependent oxidoreductase [Micromonospora krabiensis]SBV24897.1 FMN reductase [Micromonospora krabiensis]